MDTARSKSRLLVVDGDPKSLRVLDVSLKKAGFDVATATASREALALLETSVPDLIISDTDLGETDGFELCRRIKAHPDWSKIPFLFVSSRKSIEDKIRGLELGVDDYLSKPIYIKEIGIRVRTALQRAERERMESRRDGRTRFAGDLSDVGVVDLVQTIELNRKSGIIHIENRDNRRGSIFFRDGRVVDAEVGRLSGANAVYRLFSWFEGQFAVEFKHIRRHDVVDTATAQLLMEGMRRLDESTRLLERLPSSRDLLEVDCRVLADQLAELPDEVNSILRLCDGTRTLQEVVEDGDHADLEALTILSKLFAEQILFAREPPSGGGESEPGDRLAHWLSEGAAGDAPRAADPNELSEFQAVPDVADGGASRGAPTRGGGKTLKLPAVASPSPPGSCAEASEEEPFGASLFSSEQVLGSDSADATPSRNVDTLKGVPVESLFAGLSEPTPEPKTAEGLVASLARLDRNTREYGSPDEAVPTMVDQAVSGALEPESDAQPSGPVGPLSEAIREPKSDGSDHPLAQPTPDLFVEELPPGSNPLPSNQPDPASEAPPIATPEHDGETIHTVQPPAEIRGGAGYESSADGLGPARASLLAVGPDGEDPAPFAEDLGQSDVETRSARRLWPWAIAAFLVGAVGFLLVFSKSPSEVVRPAQPKHGEPVPPPASSTLAAETVTPPSPSRQIEPPSSTPPAAVPLGKDVRHAGPQLPVSADPSNPRDELALRRACVESDANGEGKPRAVEKACRPALDANPKDVDVLLILARAELDRGRLGEARSLAKRALAADPQRAEGYIYLGNVEQEAKKIEEARAAYKKYLELAPNGPFAQELRAILSNL
jgi:CheY-like chemotaxis protein